MTLDDLADAFDFDQVDADGNNHSAIIDEMFVEHQHDGVLYLTLGPLSRFVFFRHAFSTRIGGVSAYPDRALNLSLTATDNAGNVQENRRRYLRALQGNDWPLQTLRQAHSTAIHRIDHWLADGPAGDGLITSVAQIWLGIQTADCLPIFMVDSVGRAVGGFHAGWKGTAAKLIYNGVQRMREEFGTDSNRLHCGIGPGIGSCCYQVGIDVFEAFASAADHDKYLTASGLPGKFQLDLWKANTLQLMEAGVPAEQIYGQPYCTACHRRLFFSHRGERGNTGRMLAVCGLSSS